MQSHESDIESEYENEESISIQLQSSVMQVLFSSLVHVKYFRENYTLKDIESRLSQDLIQIENEKHIKEQSIIIFFNILHGKMPEELTNDEYIDLFKLASLLHSSKVSSFTKFIKNYSQSHLNNLQFSIQILLSIVNDQMALKTFGDQYLIQLEDNLSNEINFCLQDPYFSKFEIAIIHRIIDKSNKNDEFHDLLYDFINESIETRYLLFQFMDIDKLSIQKLNDLFEKLPNNQKHYQYLLNCNVNYILSLKRNNIDLSRANDEFQKQITKYEIYDHHYFEIIKAILPQVNDINEISIGGNNLLLYACESENLELVKFILSLKKFDINCRTQDEMKTPIFMAVEKENIMMIKLLLEYPEIDVNIQSIKNIDNKKESKTALYVAIEKGNYEIIDLLLTCKNINVNIGYELCQKEEEFLYFKTKNPLYLAIKHQKFEAIQSLLNFDGINPNIGSFLIIRKRIGIFPIHKERSKTPLYLSIRMQNIKTIQLLLGCKSIDVNCSIHNLVGILMKNDTYSVGKKYRDDLVKWRKLLQTSDDEKVDIKNVFIEKLLFRFKLHLKMTFKNAF